MTIPQSNPLTDDQLDELEQYLREHATDSAVTTDELADHLDIEDDHDTNPTIREAVKFLLHDGRLCVEGTSQGYAVATTEDDREAAIQSIRDHIGTLNQRVMSLQDAPLADADATDTTPDGPTCERCTSAIQGDPYLWFSVELCRDCYDAKPPSEEAFREWVEPGADA
jgi:hypothetical protein